MSISTAQLPFDNGGRRLTPSAEDDFALQEIPTERLGRVADRRWARLDSRHVVRDT